MTLVEVAAARTQQRSDCAVRPPRAELDPRQAENALGHIWESSVNIAPAERSTAGRESAKPGDGPKAALKHAHRIVKRGRLTSAAVRSNT
jgi:hypothetical protein